MRRSGRNLSLAAAALLLAAPATIAHAVPDNVAGGAANGQRLAAAWCRECHAIEASAVRSGNKAPDFALIAAMPSTTELALKVFLRSNHDRMPNLIMTPTQADDIVQYILSLRRR